ncbi:hypothetical protein METBIDRAFT_30087 [Metschnikowia bicuspidata var. bicuspidata NRRL YB-4993]|uniref:Adenylyl cyclase-associated protein n=1 Tax=Metschnikowia bicuspidata var. bicuspidata NRRL YB-4993 TaxID=869754 RepID=A0A1A0HI15_9ASCO|nr:hypothetical protein METBIDRAFT_30087 [Metschnikowia bicuspidata var. bicuspidata NRRL YB-4993]OBA23650.1 hypothetical protein METBIDRAFT_30087 [Metschnikowia bicuspidata var. bicuspidata NRRL YB-4993]
MLEENQFNVQGYNIVNILKRLEQATSRLEDITHFQEETYKSGTTPKVGNDVVKDQAEDPEIQSSLPQPESEEKVKTVREFEDLVKSLVDPFVEILLKIDLVVAEVAGNFRDAFVAQTRFLVIVSQTKKPDTADPAFMEALRPINEKISAISAAKDANRRSEYFNHLNTLSDGAPVLGWIVSETPVSFISDIKDSAQFWANRVIKDFKEKDAVHGEWVKSFYAIFDALRAYVKEYHTTGPSWNPKGKLLKETLAAESAPVADGQSPVSGNGATGIAPPPPPPPAPPANLFDEASKPENSGGLGAVFADLNKGSDVTAGLKKVDKSQMTHKNPELRKQGTLQRKPTPPKKPTALSTKTNVPQKKPARKELVDGSKWIIENFTAMDAPEPIVIEVEKTQSVFIGKTSGVTIQIKGKGNAVSISETTKTGVVVDSLISSVDVIKSFKFGVQVTGVVPLISVDKCEEGSIYLSQESVDADSQVISSNTTALNINVLDGDDFVEIPVPEQLIHTIKNGKLVSEVVEHAG